MRALSHSVPWTSISFGYTNQTRFYTSGCWERYFRIWPGNPERLPDGRWKSNEGSARVFFRVKTEFRERVLRVLEEDRKLMEGIGGEAREAKL